MFGLDLSLTFLLIFCLLAACAFEFINGFHDTANAVATVIYTHSMKPRIAVIWSGLWNFIGVTIGGIAVAMGIVNLLPVEVLVDQNLNHSIAMVMALIFTAIIWNLGTWYFGIPCSSSHTLIGSIFGVGLAFILLPGSQDFALNWMKVKDVGLSLLISPVVGFGFTLLLMFFLKKLIKNKAIFKNPDPDKAPPLWIRSILIITCTGVSWSHGSNDGQKGVGLVMLILIGIVPAQFALDRTKSPEKMLVNLNQIESTYNKINATEISLDNHKSISVINSKIDSAKTPLTNVTKFNQMADKSHFELRKDILVIAKLSDNFIKVNEGNPEFIKLNLSNEIETVKTNIKSLKTYTEYAPEWVILLISLSLGIGTMIGWKRIVLTIGEKIGKTSMTYAQGASAQLVAATTISLSSIFGLPVSTTHVLSSGVAGGMVAEDGFKNLQSKTIKNLAIAWVVTLPVTVILSGGLFILLRWILS